LERRVNILKTIDWFSVILYLILCTIGWLSVYSAMYSDAHISIFDLNQRYGKQLLFIGLALLIAIVILIIDTNFYFAFAYIFYAVTVFLLFMVLIFGKEINGARAWFEFGNFSLQPSEFAKFGTALAISKFLSSKFVRFNQVRNILKVISFLIPPVVFIVFQNDAGSALVYMVFVVVFFREGLPAWIPGLGLIVLLLSVAALFLELYFIIILLFIFSLAFYFIVQRGVREIVVAIALFSGGAGATYIYSVAFDAEISSLQIFLIALASAFIPAVIWAYRIRRWLIGILVIVVLLSITYSYSVDYIFYNIVEQHQRTRINVWFGIEQDVKGAGYNIHQSKIAIGSGGTFGKGFLKGTQTKFNFVPEQSTDFIFCTIGEEWGFVGTTFVLTLYTLLLIRMLILAERQKSAFARIYGYSVFSILLFHLVVNIGMTIGVAPVIGIPLPFFSYGGSSLWGFTILLFIFLRLDASKTEHL